MKHNKAMHNPSKTEHLAFELISDKAVPPELTWEAAINTEFTSIPTSNTHLIIGPPIT